jgi:hypothetical protein
MQKKGRKQKENKNLIKENYHNNGECRMVAITISQRACKA